MGLSRRQFTKGFKLAAVRRLEEGVSIAEVSRGLEVDPSVLQRWKKEFRAGTGNAFPGNGKARWSVKADLVQGLTASQRREFSFVLGNAIASGSFCFGNGNNFGCFAHAKS